MISVEQGTHGLFYATDTDQPGLFVAATNQKHLFTVFVLAKLAVDDPSINIPDHTIWWHPEHNQIMILPDAEWQTSEQLEETEDRAWHVFTNLWPVKYDA